MLSLDIEVLKRLEGAPSLEARVAECISAFMRLDRHYRTLFG